MNGSIRLFIFAKVGIAWTLVCLVWALRLRRHFILEALLFALGFLFLGLVGIVRATHFLLRQNEEEMRNAKLILHSEGILPTSTPERWAEFEKTSENAVRHAPRFVTLKWTPADGGWARLYRAFTGFSKKVPAPRVRD